MKMGTIHLTLAYQTLKWVSLKGPLEEPVGTQACKWIYFRVSMQSGCSGWNPDSLVTLTQASYPL